MIFNLAYLFLILALVLALFGMVAGFWGGIKRHAGLVQSNFHAVFAVGMLVLSATIILWYGLLGDHFEVAFVWNHSERALSTFFKFSALWGGQAGSLLFWTLILSIYSVTAALVFRNSQKLLMPFVNAVMLMTSAFFLILLVFAANPFEQYGIQPADGRGLNPLLQNYWMVIHPVMLYVGWVGMSVPFAFAVAVLLSKKTGNQWVRIVRRWTLVPWVFLGTGILMGSQWAYMELGWGGYWAWDPVENASFLPWLTATAFLHSILIQERRGTLKVWNVVLIWLTYMLVIYGTFATRSGLMESVHSFAESAVGWYFFAFLCIGLFGFLILLFNRYDLLRSENNLESMVSREAAFIANNWLLTGITFLIFVGTNFPTIAELVVGQRISVNPPWFNKTVGPMFLVLLLLMGIGPLLGWRSTSVAALRTQFTWPLLATLVFAAAFAFYSPRPLPIISLAICVLVTATIVQEYVRGVQARRVTNPQEGTLAAFANLLRRNPGRYGGYIVHLGVVFIGIAIVGHSFYQSTTKVQLEQGESVDLAGFRFTYIGLTGLRADNRDEYHATVEISDVATPDQLIGVTTTQRNVYDKNPDQPTSEVGLIIRPGEDLYVLLSGWDGNGEKAGFVLYVNPLMSWMWFGGIVIILGTFICVWPTPTRKENTNVVAQPAPAI